MEVTAEEVLQVVRERYPLQFEICVQAVQELTARLEAVEAGS